MAYDIECEYERWLQNILKICLPIIQKCFMHCKQYTVDLCTKTSICHNDVTVPTFELFEIYNET